VFEMARQAYRAGMREKPGHLRPQLTGGGNFLGEIHKRKKRVVGTRSKKRMKSEPVLRNAHSSGCIRYKVETALG